MENLELEPGFYNKRGYGEFEKHYLHHATVSLLKIQFKIATLMLLRNIYFLFFIFNITINIFYHTYLWVLNKII